MRLAMVGLGRMGLNMAVRLRRGGHRVVGYDPFPKAVAQAARAGIRKRQHNPKCGATRAGQRDAARLRRGVY